MSDNFWRLWWYHTSDEALKPLAHYRDKNRCDTAAFDLAHAISSLEDASVLDSITREKDSDPTPLDSKTAALLRALAARAIMDSAPPEPGKSTVSVETTPDDRVHVVRLPGLETNSP